MGLETTETRVVYTGNGITRTFPVPFPLFSEDHVVLVRMGSTGKELALHYNYAVHDVSLGLPYVVYPVDPLAPALGSGEKLVIMRVLPLVQQTNLENGGIVQAEVLEKQFDIITMQLQQLAEILTRVPKFPVWTEPESANAQSFIDQLDALASRAEKAARRAESVMDASIIRTGQENLDATWSGPALAAGEVLEMPVHYLPGKNVLWLSVDGVFCHAGSAPVQPEGQPEGQPSAQAVEQTLLQYEEIPTDQDVSCFVRLLFDAPAGAVWNARVVASNLTLIAQETVDTAFATAERLKFLTDLAAGLDVSDMSVAMALRQTVMPGADRETTIPALSDVAAPPYCVGTGALQVYLDGLLALAGDNPQTCQYREVGTYGTSSEIIQFYDNMEPDVDVVLQALGPVPAAAQEPL